MCHRGPAVIGCGSSHPEAGRQESPTALWEEVEAEPGRGTELPHWRLEEEVAAAEELLTWPALKGECRGHVNTPLNTHDGQLASLAYLCRWVPMEAEYISLCMKRHGIKSKYNIAGETRKTSSWPEVCFVLGRVKRLKRNKTAC